MIYTVSEILALRKTNTLVFTNGVFDILHAGHVGFLEEAKRLGDMLVVGLNTDDSVRKLEKAPGRPVNTLEDRARVVGALRCVDAVVCFAEETPVELIAKLKPDFHVKGGDYSAQALPEYPTVTACGGQVVILPILPGRSTTSIIARLSRQPSED